MTTILVVEDDDAVREALSEVLSTAGYRVLTAVHGAEGVHLARKHRPDLIIMDLRMPIMGGWDAVRYVQTDPKTKGIPVWVVSAYQADDARHGEGPETTAGSLRSGRNVPPPSRTGVDHGLRNLLTF